MTRLTGIEHLALATDDMRSTLDFYTRVLGLPLGGLFWMHGVDGAVHAFLSFPDGRSLSFIQFAESQAGVPGVSHAESMFHGVPAGVMQHVALQVDDEETLDTLRDRIRAHGVKVTRSIDHGFVRSIYFDGPDGVHLEVGCPLRPLDDREFDVSAAEHCGISEHELDRMRDPSLYEPIGDR